MTTTRARIEARFEEALAQYDLALAAYRAIPSRSRKLKHEAAERMYAARQALKHANNEVDVALAEYNVALAAYRAIPAANRELKHQAAEQFYAARKQVLEAAAAA